MRLGVNLCFAVKRLTEPEAWAEFVRADLGLDTVQFTFDLLDPWWPEVHRRTLIRRVRARRAGAGPGDRQRVRRAHPPYPRPAAGPRSRGPQHRPAMVAARLRRRRRARRDRDWRAAGKPQRLGGGRLRGAFRRPLPRPAGQHRGHHLPRGSGRASRAADRAGPAGPGVPRHHHAMPAVARTGCRTAARYRPGSRWTSAAPSSNRDTARRPAPSPGSAPWARAYSCSALTTPVAAGTRAGDGRTSKGASAWLPSPRASAPPAWTASRPSCRSARGSRTTRRRSGRHSLPLSPTAASTWASPPPTRRGRPGRLPIEAWDEN